jgi:hypothetical protein
MIKVTLVIVEGSIASLKVADIALFTVTPVAALSGTVELTVGGVLYGVVVGIVVVVGVARVHADASVMASIIIIDTGNPSTFLFFT